MVNVESAKTSPFLDACRLRPTDVTPVWFMRQAGRYMPEYRRIRERHTLLEICADSELATEVTLQPISRLGVDAAILFADILLPLIPMGLDLEFVPEEGPHFHNPVRTVADVQALRAIEPSESLAHVLDTVRLVKQELSGATPLIGFAGGPFTLASYAIEGGPTRSFLRTKQMMLAEPQSFDALLRKLADVVSDYVAAQVEAGADAIQIFDSWIGCLSSSDYERFVQPHSRAIFERLRACGVPSIHFGVGTGMLLTDMKAAGGDVIGLDWRVPLDAGWRQVGHDRGIQGNLDPAALFAPRDELQRRIRDILRQAGGRAGHIFNLGHGVLPTTPVDNVKAAVDLVHEMSARLNA